MSHLQPELIALKESVLEMLALVMAQFHKAREATLHYNYELAQDVVAREKRVNGFELRIDKDCENILALYNPVAIDLRFVLACLKINNNLERIGDNAESIAQYVSYNGAQIAPLLLERFRLAEMFECAIAMLGDVYAALRDEDTDIARQVFKRDFFLNENNLNATAVAVDIVSADSSMATAAIPVLSTVRKLERVGDHTKNIAEEIIFYIEAKVLKHSGKQIGQDRP